MKPGLRVRAGLLVAAACLLPLAPHALARQEAAGATGATTAFKAAPGGTVYRLLGFSLRGTKRVDLAALVAALPQHAGDRITPAEIKADTDRIRAELDARHVHGNLTTALLEQDGKGHRIWVLWDIQKLDAMSYLPLRPKRHFGSQTFSGNVKLSSAELDAITGFHPGDRMPDGSVGDARTGIEQAYDKVFPGASVEVKGAVALRKDDSVSIRWTIVEPK